MDILRWNRNLLLRSLRSFFFWLLLSFCPSGRACAVLPAAASLKDPAWVTLEAREDGWEASGSADVSA